MESNFNGEILRNLRKRADLTLEQVASAVGTSVTTLHRLEKSEVTKKKDYNLVVAIANYFGIPVDEMSGKKQRAFSILRDLKVADILDLGDEEIVLDETLRNRLESAIRKEVVFWKAEGGSS